MRVKRPTSQTQSHTRSRFEKKPLLALTISSEQGRLARRPRASGMDAARGWRASLPFQKYWGAAARAPTHGVPRHKAASPRGAHARALP